MMKTPYYLFQIEQLEKQIHLLEGYFPASKLVYAMKANPHIVGYVSQYVEKIEVCSFGELKQCLKQKVDPQKVVLSGVNKGKEELESLFKNHIDIGTYTIESLRQLEILDDLTSKYHKRINLLLRLSSNNQFGLDESTIENIVEKKYSYMDIIGIQFYSGTQKKSLKKMKREIELLNEFVGRLPECIQIIEYGPGIMVNYFKEDKENIDLYLQELASLIATFDSKYEIHLEIGRAMVASCGSYHSRVVDLKTTNDIHYAIVDGGIHQITYYGSNMAMKQPIIEVKGKTGEQMHYFICGSLCTVNDILVRNGSFPVLEIGDEIIFKNAGAYCVSEGIALFLTRDLPSIYIEKDGQITLIRERKEVIDL